MHSKILNPRLHGKFVFSNRGSCKGLVTYLGHEARDHGISTDFFNDEKSGIQAEVVKVEIDANAKGLRKQQEKFFSLVLSPSKEELEHLNKDPEKLKSFTREVMRNYAANFQKTGSSLSSADLVWFATMHDERKVKQGEQKWISKSGSHQHIHVIVGGQDKSGTLRLNPRYHQSHFSIKEWQRKNGKTFQQMFDYEKSTVSERLHQGLSQEQIERHRERIENRVGYLNQYFVGSQKININIALSIAEDKQYGRAFFFHLHRLTQHYQKGEWVQDPYQFLEKGKVDKRIHSEKSFSHFSNSIQQMTNDFTDEEELFKLRRKKKKSIELDYER